MFHNKQMIKYAPISNTRTTTYPVATKNMNCPVVKTAMPTTIYALWQRSQTVGSYIIRVSLSGFCNCSDCFCITYL